MKRVMPKVRGMKKNLAGILLVWNTFSLKKKEQFRSTNICIESKKRTYNHGT